MIAAKGKANAHAKGVGFYSYIAAKVIPNTTESVDEVISPRFFFCLFSALGLNHSIY